MAVLEGLGLDGERDGDGNGKKRNSRRLGHPAHFAKDLGDLVTAAATGASLTQLGFSTMGNPGNPVFSDKSMTGFSASNGEPREADSGTERYFGDDFGYGMKREKTRKAWSSRGPGVQCTPWRLAFG